MRCRPWSVEMSRNLPALADPGYHLPVEAVVSGSKGLQDRERGGVRTRHRVSRGVRPQEFREDSTSGSSGRNSRQSATRP